VPYYISSDTNAKSQGKPSSKQRFSLPKDPLALTFELAGKDWKLVAVTSWFDDFMGKTDISETLRNITAAIGRDREATSFKG